MGDRGEAPVVQSTVGTTLRHFGYLDGRRQFWYAAEVPPGARVALQKREAIGAAAAIAGFATDWAEGSFYALGGATAEIPLPTLRGIRWDPAQDRVLYTGLLPAREANP